MPDDKSLETLVTSLFESLQAEMRTGFTELNTRLDDLNSRFDAQALRLDRQGALLQNGSRWTARMNEWAEHVDTLLEARTRDIAELREEIRRLKHNNDEAPQS